MQISLVLLSHGEEYIMNYPNAYGMPHQRRGHASHGAPGDIAAAR